MKTNQKLMLLNKALKKENLKLHKLVAKQEAELISLRNSRKARMIKPLVSEAKLKEILDRVCRQTKALPKSG
jgi:hypothetical protein